MLTPQHAAQSIASRWLQHIIHPWFTENGNLFLLCHVQYWLQLHINDNLGPWLISSLNHSSQLGGRWVVIGIWTIMRENTVCTCTYVIKLSISQGTGEGELLFIQLTSVLFSNNITFIYATIQHHATFRTLQTSIVVHVLSRNKWSYMAVVLTNNRCHNILIGDKMFPGQPSPTYYCWSCSIYKYV